MEFLVNGKMEVLNSQKVNCKHLQIAFHSKSMRIAFYLRHVPDMSFANVLKSLFHWQSWSLFVAFLLGLRAIAAFPLGGMNHGHASGPALEIGISPAFESEDSMRVFDLKNDRQNVG